MQHIYLREKVSRILICPSRILRVQRIAANQEEKDSGVRKVPPKPNNLSIGEWRPPSIEDPKSLPVQTGFWLYLVLDWEIHKTEFHKEQGTVYQMISVKAISRHSGISCV